MQRRLSKVLPSLLNVAKKPTQLVGFKQKHLDLKKFRLLINNTLYKSRFFTADHYS